MCYSVTEKSQNHDLVVSESGFIPTLCALYGENIIYLIYYQKMPVFAQARELQKNCGRKETDYGKEKGKGYSG